MGGCEKVRLGKDNKRKRHSNEFMRTSFANSGRIAGSDILYDDYSETSYPSGITRTDYFPEKKVGIPLTEEEKKFRDEGGPVTVYKIEDMKGGSR